MERCALTRLMPMVACFTDVSALDPESSKRGSLSDEITVLRLLFGERQARLHPGILP